LTPFGKDSSIAVKHSQRTLPPEFQDVTGLLTKNLSGHFRKNRRKRIIPRIFHESQISSRGLLPGPGRGHGGTLLAQQQKKKEEDIHVDVTVSAITITVQDSRAKFVNNLSERDFTVYENNKKKPLTYFMHDFGAPLSLRSKAPWEECLI